MFESKKDLIKALRAADRKATALAKQITTIERMAADLEEMAGEVADDELDLFIDLDDAIIKLDATALYDMSFFSKEAVKVLQRIIN